MPPARPHRARRKVTHAPSTRNGAAQRLRIALDANASAYRHAVQSSAPGECWDFLVLTAANEKQAEGYRQELALRARAVGPSGAFFPQIQRTLVVADPPGPKIGSGGATLGVMRSLSRQFDLHPADLDRVRVLLIHSGGMSQRLPMYSPLGKIFAPLPLLRPDGQIATLFDHLYVTLAGLPDRLGPGMLVLAGDVFLLFDHRQVTAPPPGVTAVSMRVGAELGRGHGVFVTRPDGRILHTLQKVSPEEMAARGATGPDGRVLIDTGLLFFDPDRLRALHAMSRSIRASTEIDLYDDMTAALAAGTARDAYLRARCSSSLRRRLWRRLHGTPFNLAEVDGEFLHLGTTRQFRDAMTGRDPSPAAALFQQDVLSRVSGRHGAGSRVYQSVVSNPRSTLGPGSVVEHSLLDGPCRIGAGTVVSQVVESQGARVLEVPKDLLLFQVPLRVGRPKESVEYAQVVCGVDDDFKSRFSDGGCRYLNRPIDAWLRRHRLTPRAVWPHVEAGKRTLWNARLFIATSRRGHAHLALALAAPGGASPGALLRWRTLRRVSMADVLASADPLALIADREIVSARLQALAVLDAIQAGDDRPVDSMVAHFATAEAYGEAHLSLVQDGHVSRDTPLTQLNRARATWTAAQLLRRPSQPSAYLRSLGERCMESAFMGVAIASEQGHGGANGTAPAPGRVVFRPGVEVVATSPVRLDLGGGWSDTPPYCFERGGHVVNVAVNLEGRPPVSATVTTLPDPVLIVESYDLGRKLEMTESDDGESVDVKDPFALHKVALRMTGLLPDGATSLSRFLKNVGAGLRVTTEARVPKGSGLGTSSILAATLLAALHAVRGRRPSRNELIGQTLLLEQRLGTGGGWQDQVGGVAPGVKSTVTGPGIPQKPDVEVLRLSGRRLDALEERLVVYYSGQQRLARDILRRVMGRWLAREPAVVQLMVELKQSAAALRKALLRGRWPDAAEQINRYWQIKKSLYPGSTTPATDQLFLEMRGDYLAAGLSGAGGGGFAYFLCKDARQADRLRRRLAEHSARPGAMGNVYATQINREGLRVQRSRAET